MNTLTVDAISADLKFYLSGRRRLILYREGGITQERLIGPGWINADMETWNDAPTKLRLVAEILRDRAENLAIVNCS